MSWHLFLGLIATWLVEGSYVPQLWRLYKLKHADEFSLLFPLLNLMGRIAGLAASILKQDAVFSGFFLVGIVVRLTLLCQVLYYRARARRLHHA